MPAPFKIPDAAFSGSGMTVTDGPPADRSAAPLPDGNFHSNLGFFTIADRQDRIRRR
jgi:hypothetical protein